MTTSSLLAADAVLEKVATGATWAEGPVWLPHRRAVRFSDIPGNRILEYSEVSGELEVFAEGVEFTNGRTLDLDGNVVECSHGRRAVQRDTAVGPGDAHDPTTLVDSFGGQRLNSPNDVVVASDGSIWFTDPSYGIKRPEEGHAGEEEYGDRWVFRFDERDGSLTPVVIDVEAPNGLAFSPDESLLYVADSSLSPATAGTGTCVGSARFGLLVIAATITVLLRLLPASFWTMRTGRVPPCSHPITGSRNARNTSPLRGCSLIGHLLGRLCKRLRAGFVRPAAVKRRLRGSRPPARTLIAWRALALSRAGGYGDVKVREGRAALIKTDRRARGSEPPPGKQG